MPGWYQEAAGLAIAPGFTQRIWPMSLGGSSILPSKWWITCQSLNQSFNSPLASRWSGLVGLPKAWCPSR